MADKAAKPKNKQPTDKNTRELPGAFSLFSPSWEALKLNFGTFLLLFIFVLAAVTVAIVVGVLLAVALKDTPALLYPLIAVLAVALIGFLMVLAPATVHAQLKSAQEDTVDFDSAFQRGKQLVWRFWGMSILIGLIVLVGFILLIIPGFFMIKRYLLAPYFMVDKDLDISGAMKASAEAGKAYSGAVWGVLGVEILIGLVNSIPYLGSIAGFILNIGYYCAPAVRYEQIKAAS